MSQCAHRTVPSIKTELQFLTNKSEKSLRILVGNSNAGMVGGAESYLKLAIDGLLKAGHQVAFLFERDVGKGTDWLMTPSSDVPTWIGDVTSAGNWCPDIVFNHGFLSPSLEKASIKIAPSVLFAHNYYGTCISGTKSWIRPRKCCTQKFGLRCLLNYFPCGCGGKNPRTMISNYLLAEKRRALFPSYAAIIVGSNHMRSEFNRHISIPSKIKLLPLPILSSGIDVRNSVHNKLADFDTDRPVKLLFVGRMEPNKGPRIAAEAARIVAGSCGRNVVLRYVGDGSERKALEADSDAFLPARLEFGGWRKSSELHNEFSQADLLMFPSLWPEPFGLVGLDAALSGLPCVGYAHGGVTDWLKEGIVGHLAKATPPTAQGLADAVMKCIASSQTLKNLSLSAQQFAQRWPDMPHHVEALVSIFRQLID